MHFEIYQRPANALASASWGTCEWRWRLRGGNGDVIAIGEGFKSELACRHSIDLVRSTSLDTPVRRVEQ